MRTARRGHRGSPAMTWAAVAAALVAHAALLGTTHALGVSIVGESGFASVTKGKDKLANRARSQAELLRRCVPRARRSHDDVPRAVGERPRWLHDTRRRRRCGSSCRRVRRATRRGSRRSRCSSRSSADKVTPIDPEPLHRDDEAAAEQPKPPKPVPPPQPQQQPPPPPPAPPAPARADAGRRDREADRARSRPRTRASSPSTTSSVEKQKVARGSVRSRWSRSRSRPSSSRRSSRRKRRSRSRIATGRRGANTEAPDVPGTLVDAQRRARRARARRSKMPRRAAAWSARPGPLALDGFVPTQGDGAIRAAAPRSLRSCRAARTAPAAVQPDVPNLKPTQEVLERALGGGNVDHLDDVDNGDETALNAKRWIHASFFNRLKRQVAQNWDPAIGVAPPRSERSGLRLQDARHRGPRRADREGRAREDRRHRAVGRHASSTTRRCARSMRPRRSRIRRRSSRARTVSITFAFSFYFEIGAPRTSWRVIRSHVKSRVVRSRPAARLAALSARRSAVRAIRATTAFRCRRIRCSRRAAADAADVWTTRSARPRAASGARCARARRAPARCCRRCACSSARCTGRARAAAAVRRRSRRASRPIRRSRRRSRFGSSPARTMRSTISSRHQVGTRERARCAAWCRDEASPTGGSRRRRPSGSPRCAS